MKVQTSAMTGILWGQARRNSSDKVLLSKCMTMCAAEAGNDQSIQHTYPIPASPPEPYRHSGVDITPFKGAPHLGRVLKEARRKGKRLLMSPLSVKPKVRALC